MPNDAALRRHIIDLLKGGQAHANLEQGLRGLSFEQVGQKPARAAHTAWELIEHIRIAQGDILEFSRDPGHPSPEWPKGYWPAISKPLNRSAWERSRAAVKTDLAAFQALIADDKNDLLAPLPRDRSKTLLREALLLADHNSYHLGQLIAVRKMLGLWNTAR